MKFKENGGVSPVALSVGFERIEDDAPYSGENIMHPRHVEEERRMAKLRAEYAWPDEKQDENGPEGFLDRDVPTPYERPQRSETEDRG